MLVGKRWKLDAKKPPAEKDKEPVSPGIRTISKPAPVNPISPGVSNKLI